VDSPRTRRAHEKTGIQYPQTTSDGELLQTTAGKKEKEMESSIAVGSMGGWNGGRRGKNSMGLCGDRVGNKIKGGLGSEIFNKTETGGGMA